MLCKLGFPGAQMVRNPPAMQETRAQSLGREDPLEKGMATHSSVLAKNFQDSGAWRATDHRVSESRHNRAMCTFCFPVLLTKPQIPLQDVCEAGSDSSCPQFSEKGELRTRRESGGRRFPNQAGSERQTTALTAPSQHSRSAAVQGTSLYPCVHFPRLILNRHEPRSKWRAGYNGLIILSIPGGDIHVLIHKTLLI